MRMFAVFPRTDARQLIRMLTRPRWLLSFFWQLASYIAWLVRNRQLPTPYNIPFKLIFIWPEPLPTKEQIDEFNASREEATRKLKSKLDELKALVEKARMEECMVTDYDESDHLGECIECGKVILSWEEVYCDQCQQDLEAEGFFS